MDLWDVLPIATAQTHLLLAALILTGSAPGRPGLSLAAFTAALAGLALAPVYNAPGPPGGQVFRVAAYTLANLTPLTLAVLAGQVFADRDIGRPAILAPGLVAVALNSIDLSLSAGGNWPRDFRLILVFEYLPQAVAAAYVAYAIFAVFSGLNGDLVAGRHRLRLWALVALAVIGLEMVVVENLIAVAVALPYDPTRFHQVWQAAFALWLAAQIARPRSIDWLALRARDDAPPPRSGVDWSAKSAALAGLVAEATPFRDDTLDMDRLAGLLALPRYRLRELLNVHEGHRNFRDFLNEVRVGIAARDLHDPAKAHLPILTLAHDAGFGSLAPFNRAFKARMGMTPGDWRKRAPRG